MVIVIKKGERRNWIFNNKNITILDKICPVKNITSKSNILVLLDLNVDNDGIITDYNFFLEEVIITVPIETIITNFANKKVEEICLFHNVNLIII